MKALLSRYKGVDRSVSAAASEESAAEKPPAKRFRADTAARAAATDPAFDGTLRIVFQCLEGSVTHYYHFFFGAMIPLILHHVDASERAPPLYRIVTDVGPMKRILCEIPLNVIEFRGPDLLAEGGFHDDKSMRHVLLPGDTALQAYDAYNSEYYTDDYVTKLSKAQLRRVLAFFESTVPPYLLAMPVFDILLIERVSDSYYSAACKDRSEIYKTSGAQRRSLSNHAELVHALKTRYGDRFCNIVLERSSIYYQYRMFRAAKVVIAQHGAALANILFMMNGGSGKEGGRGVGAVIEISPPWSRQYEHFKNLAHACGVPHTSVLQESDHSAVDIDRLMECVERGASGPL